MIENLPYRLNIKKCEVPENSGFWMNDIIWHIFVVKFCSEGMCPGGSNYLIWKEVPFVSSGLVTSLVMDFDLTVTGKQKGAPDW